MAEVTKSCDFCPFLKMQEFEAASDIKVKVDVTKGSLISESFFLQLKSPKKGAKYNPIEHYPLKEKMLRIVF